MLMLASPQLLKGLVHPTLIDMIAHLHGSFGGLTVTSLHREGDPGVHGTIPVRGADLRCRDMSVGNAICKLINRKYTYDPERPEMKCALIHDVGFGIHLHLQVHPNTRRV